MGGEHYHQEPKLGGGLTPKGPATKEQYLLKPPQDIVPSLAMPEMGILADNFKDQGSVLVCLSGCWILEFDVAELLLGV